MKGLGGLEVVTLLVEVRPGVGFEILRPGTASSSLPAGENTSLSYCSSAVSAAVPSP